MGEKVAQTQAGPKGRRRGRWGGGHLQGALEGCAGELGPGRHGELSDSTSLELGQ